MDAPIVPYKINVPDAKIEALKAKLDQTTYPDPAPVLEDWEYGAPRAATTRLAKYWRDGFDWRAQEAELNKVPHFKTDVAVDGFGDIGVHFVHQESQAEDAIPLLFCHGWPGSFIEVVKILPLLTSADADVPFHVVAPSLPNFGFSDGVGKPGFGLAQYAEAIHKIMLKLGYDRYAVTQGGDWGFGITRMVGRQYPEHCLASHLNHVYCKPPELLKNPLLYLQSKLPSSALDLERKARTDWFFEEGSAYNRMHSTRPSTLGFALADSPVSLLAWIYEKLVEWTDGYDWSDDEVLTWVGLYWFSTAGPDASTRIYKEAQGRQVKNKEAHLEYMPGVKLGMSMFPKDLMLFPSSWQRTLGPVVFERWHTEGGHFAAWERPELLVEDITTMFGEGGGASDVARKIVKERRT
ncbi:hypothetical protein BN1723_010677 [Verticillium longisporum]|uniref:Epoxide hydrolase N-terminal domain-containing protein n=1 Tax=Verticillium longisporum TaxID=100787 RepID=A0A0G4L0B0_VERLO|nr:hypothetical protein BN1723_010677 [Verticillium longisporum]